MMNFRGKVKTYGVQLLLEGVAAFSPEHSAHELQSLNLHFSVNGDLSRAHQPLQPATSACRALVVAANGALSTSIKIIHQAFHLSHTERGRERDIYIFKYICKQIDR